MEIIENNYFESTIKIIETIETNKDYNNLLETSLLQYLIDSIAAIKQIYTLNTFINNNNNNNTPRSNNTHKNNNLYLIILPFINQLKYILKECYLESSLLFQNSKLSRNIIVKHILSKFPEFVTKEDLIFIDTTTSSPPSFPSPSPFFSSSSPNQKQKQKEEKKIEQIKHELPLIHYAVYNCRNLELIKSIYDVNSKIFESKDNNGALPLHWSTLQHPTIPLIFKSDIQTFLLEKYPSGVYEEDNEGNLALHWAVNQDYPDVSLIRKLLEMFPESASKPSNKGLLPLHLAINRSQPIPELILCLLEYYPEAISEPCSKGWLPLHYCVNHSDINLSMLKLIVEKYPEGINYRSDDGQIPLHRLLDQNQPTKRAAKYLIQLDPNILKISDNEGYLPIHTLLHSSEPPASSLVKLLIHSNFSSIKQKTKQGWLPIHLAMKLSESIKKNDENDGSGGSEKLGSPGLIKQFTNDNLNTVDNNNNKANSNNNDGDNNDNNDNNKANNNNNNKTTTLPIQRIVAVIQELLSIYPESAYEPVIDIVPFQDDVDLETWTGGWKKIRWTPMSYASIKGKPPQLARALRPFRKKNPLTPSTDNNNNNNNNNNNTPYSNSSNINISNITLPQIHSISQLGQNSSTVDLETGYMSPSPIKLNSSRPNTTEGKDLSRFHFSSLATPQSAILSPLSTKVPIETEDV